MKKTARKESRYSTRFKGKGKGKGIKQLKQIEEIRHIIEKGRQKCSLWLAQVKQYKHIRYIQKTMQYIEPNLYSLRALLKKYHKKGLNNLGRLDPLLFLKEPWLCLGQAKKALLAILRKGDLYLQKLMQIPPRPFHFMLTLLVIVFAALSLLSASNPFRLLFPAFSFPILHRDERKPLTFYALSRKKTSLTAMQQSLIVSESLDLRLRLLASLIAEPLHSKLKAGQAYTDLAVLPLLGNSIRRVWQPYAGHIIIDLSKEAIAYEMQLFNQLGQGSDKSKEEAYYQDAFFKAFSASIFEMEKELQSMEFWLDGKPERLSAMSFNIEQKLTRTSIWQKSKKEAPQ